MIEPLLQAERLITVGMLDQAEQIYRRVAQQDPHNAIALVGLARVALERGNESAALEHARAALAIDPDNPAALRLEARLREVLAQRGGQRAEAGAAAGEPPWVSTAPPLAAPQTRPSEQRVFARNPSMTDHRAMETQEQTAASPEPSPEPVPEEATPTERSATPGLIGRLLRRDR